MERRKRSGMVWKVRIAITSKHVNGRRPRGQMWKHVKNIGIMENGKGGEHMEMSEIMVRKSAHDSTFPLRPDPQKAINKLLSPEIGSPDIPLVCAHPLRTYKAGAENP